MRLFVRWLIVCVVFSYGGSSPQAEERVPLHIDWPVPDAKVAFPIYCGLSLPQGNVTSADQIRVVDDQETNVPVGVEPLAKWTPEKSIKWVGLHFLAQADKRYFAVIDAATPRAARIQVRETEQAIVIDTQVAQFTLPRIGPLFGLVKLGETTLLPGDAACLLLQDQQGRVADETRGPVEEAPRVEVNGGEFVVVRREGLLRTAQGDRLGKYIVRLEFQAGSGTIKLQHTFVNTENTNDVQYADLAIRLRPAIAPQWQAAFEPSPGVGSPGTELEFAL